MAMYLPSRKCWAVDVPAKVSWTGKRLKPLFKDKEEALAYELKVMRAVKEKRRLLKPMRGLRSTNAIKANVSYWNRLLDEVYDERWADTKDGLQSRRKAEMVIIQLNYKMPEDITKKDLLDAKKERLKTIKANTFNKQLTSFNCVIKYAIEEGYIESFPPIPLTKAKVVRSQKTRRMFAEQEQVELITLLLREKGKESYCDIADFIDVMYDVAARNSELFTLKPYNINLKERMFAFIDTKTSTDRWIPYGDITHAILERRLNRRDVKQSQKVFPDVTQDTLEDAWNWAKKILVLNKLLPKEALEPNVFVPYSLRHGMATTMLEKTRDIRVVQELLGHSSIKTTEVYTHVTASRLKDARKQLDEVEDLKD